MVNTRSPSTTAASAAFVLAIGATDDFRKCRQIRPQHGDIFLRIECHEFAFHLALLIELHGNVSRWSDNVLICQDQPIRAYNEAASVPEFAPYGHDAVLIFLEKRREIIPALRPLL